MQWKIRPDDVQFITIDALRKAVAARRAASYERAAQLDKIAVRSEDTDIILYDTRNPAGGAKVSHYAFTQICARAKAPAGFLRSMPTKMSADVLEWALEENAQEPGEGKLLLSKEEESLPTLRAITGQGYGRIWDLDIVDAVAQLCEVNTGWTLAQSPNASSGISDRGLFVFLINPDRAVKQDDNVLYPGIFIQNSETGKDVFEMAPFLYEPSTDTRVLVSTGKTRIRHNRRAPMRFLQEALPDLTKHLETDVRVELESIKRSKGKIIATDPNGAKPWLQHRGFATAIITAATAKLDDKAAVTLWSLEQSLISAARDLTHMDERIDLERKASKLLSA
jgi:hypothetical protein